jgi:hypothetical protein
MIKVMAWVSTPYGWDVFGCDELYQNPQHDEAPKACLGSSSLIRMSWVLACFHAFMVLTILPRGDAAAQWHDGCWGTKSMIVFAGWVASQWLPNAPFIEGYMQMARAVSLLFLMYQAVLMLIVAMVINSALVNGCGVAVLLALTIVITGGNITWVVF